MFLQTLFLICGGFDGYNDPNFTPRRKTGEDPTRLRIMSYNIWNINKFDQVRRWGNGSNFLSLAQEHGLMSKAMSISPGSLSQAD